MNKNIQIPVNFYEEGDLVIATSPALDITTQGENFDDARKNFDELLAIFFEEYDTDEKLEKVLLECGWSKVSNSYSPPREIGRIFTNFRLPQFA